MALRYPSMPAGGVDAGSIIDMFNSGYDRSKARADERKNIDAFDQLLSGQTQPQALSGLGAMFSPQHGSIQRSPLAAPTDPATARVEQAFAAQGQGSAPTELNSNAIAARFLKTIRDGGITNPYALAAIAATGKRESGFDPKNAVRTWSDPSQSGQAGTAGGIMSWRNERLQALQQFAQQNGDDPRAPSPETQAEFLLAEDPTLIRKLQSAGSAEEAQQMMNNAWRYAGYDQPGGETAQRMALAGQYAQQFGASPSQQALEGLAVGQSMPMGQGVQVADASGQMMPQGGSILPPRDVMMALFRAPATRPLAIQLAQAAQQMKIDANDPMARVKYETAVAQLEQLRNPQLRPSDQLAREKFEWEKSQGISGQGRQAPASIQEFEYGQQNPDFAEWMKTKGRDAPLTATDKKAILEADEMVMTNQNTLDMLRSVLTENDGPGSSLNDRAGSGAMARTQSWLARNDPTGFFDDAKGQATTELENVVLGQALSSLKSIFGAAPTEGERKILVDLQASVDKTPKERKAIIERGIALAEKRLQFNQERANSLRNEEFYKPGRNGAQSPGSATSYKSRYGLE